MAQGEEEEQSLLLSHVIVVNAASASPSPPTSTMCHPVCIEEQQVFIDLGAAEEGDHCRWVLDNGATNHMSGSRDIFAELNSDVCGTVRFGDGSVMRTEGHDSIVLTCKNGGHHDEIMHMFVAPGTYIRMASWPPSFTMMGRQGCDIVLKMTLS
jgi:hypothetical protein